MELLLFWFGLSIVVGYVAGQRGRSGVGWFLISCFISPLLAVILLALLPNQPAHMLSLTDQVNYHVLHSKYNKYVRSYKPALSASVVYDVNLNGQRHRFQTKVEALAFCAANIPDQPQDSFGTQTEAPASPAIVAGLKETPADYYSHRGMSEY